MSFLIATFYAWRRFILVCGLAGLLVVGAVAFLLPRWYRSTTTLVPPEPSAVLSISEEIVRQLAAPLLGRVETGASPAAVCIEVLRSRTVGEALIREFGLMDSYQTGTMDECLDALRSHADFTATENGAVVISFEDRSPVRAAMIANRATALLDSVMRDLKLTRAARTRDFVEQRMLERQEMLAQAENRFRDFQESSHAVVIDEQLAAAMELVTDLTARAISLEIEMAIAATYSSRTSLEYQRLQVEYDGVVGQLARLKTHLDGDDGGESVSGTPVLDDVPEIALEYGRLRRDVEVQTRVYRTLVAAFEKSSLEAARNTPVVQVLDPAVPPTEHARPHRAILILAGFGLELVWTLALVLAVSAWREGSEPAAAARNLLAPVARDFAWLRRRGGA